MVTTATRRPIPAAGGQRTPYRGARPIPRRPEPEHHAPPKSQLAQPIAVGAAAALALALLIGTIWAFGNAGISGIARLPESADPAPPPTPVSRTTRVYRDMHDGRVTVMDIDANGTRVIGTMAKDKVPMISKVDKDAVPAAMDSQSRLHALGSNFR